jgi:acyl-CoA dehydrogenase
MQSCFAMTEPDQPGSDPRSIQTRAVRDGDEWVINGHKWFASNAEAAHFAIVMCRTEADDGAGGVNDKMTQIIVPTDTPGFEVIRSVPVWGHQGGHHGEIILDDARVPIENQLGRSGSGHQAAQDRLGAGRVFHCMNCIGQMWRAFDMMVRRSMEREVHGGLLETKQFIQGFIADSYMDIQSSRLMTIHCAEVMESGGDARTEISAIKVFVPAAMERVVDRAIRHAARGHVPRSPHAAPRGWPRRGAPHPHREERAQEVPQWRIVGLRDLRHRSRRCKHEEMRCRTARRASKSSSSRRGFEGSSTRR